MLCYNPLQTRMNKNKPPPPTFNQQESSLVTELRQLASLGDVNPLTNGIDDGGFGSGTNPPVDDQEESSTEYTSLQDIIAEETSSPQHTLTCNFVSAQQSTSPTAGRTCCWGEVDVAISNPLVKQAAIAYLQPKMTPPDIDHRGWTERFKEYLCGSCDGGEGGGGRIGCLGGFVGGVFAGMIGWIFGSGARREETELKQRRDHQD